MADQPQVSPEDLKRWEDVKTRMLRMAQDFGVVLEELRIAQLDVNTTAAAADCCCCCTPGSCCTGAAAVPLAAA
jgi:hypothetical protein